MCIDFVVFQLPSYVWLFVTATHLAPLSIISWSLLKFMSIESVMLSNHRILCHPLLLLPLIYPRIGIFSTEGTLHIWWPKYWCFSFSISPSNEYSGSVSFRIAWFDLSVQRILKSLLQYHNLKAPILCCSAFFMVQLSYLCMTTGKTTTLTMQTFVCKVMVFSMLSQLVIHFPSKE